MYFLLRFVTRDFFTWPCDVNKDGVVPLDLALGDDKVKFEELIKIRQQEENS